MGWRSMSLSPPIQVRSNTDGERRGTTFSILLPGEIVTLLADAEEPENDYRKLQAATAAKLAEALNIDVSVVYAQNEGITQSQQLLALIQGPVAVRPDGILMEPAGSTALRLVAQAATKAGIAWGLMNCESDYIEELSRQVTVPVFEVSADQMAIGRLQGEMIVASAPAGALVLYVQGPTSSGPAKQRASGTLVVVERSGRKLQILSRVSPDWTEAAGYRSISNWLKLKTAAVEPVRVVAAQNDLLAMGARRALGEAREDQRERWLALPFFGVDGIPATGQKWVSQGALRATVVVPPVVEDAIQILISALRDGIRPPLRTLIAPHPFNPLEKRALSTRQGKAVEGLNGLAKQPARVT